MFRRIRQTRPLALLLLAAAYAAIIVFGGCADRMLLFPTTHPIDAGQAIRRMIDVDGRTVEVWTARSPAVLEGAEVHGFVLEFGGNATRAEQIVRHVADRWQRHAIEVWVMNYPGFGGSEGPARLARIPGAAIATYDQLQRVAGERPIFVAGNSLGSAAALHVAANRPTAGLVLQNPPPLQRLIVRRHGWWNLWLAAGPVALQVPPELNALLTAPRVHSPGVFLLADQDEIVPPVHQRAVVDAYAGPKRIIPLAASRHNTSISGLAQRQLTEALDWLWSTGAGEPAALDIGR
jgi:uncharacterized protein